MACVLLCWLWCVLSCPHLTVPPGHGLCHRCSEWASLQSGTDCNVDATTVLQNTATDFTARLCLNGNGVHFLAL